MLPLNDLTSWGYVRAHQIKTHLICMTLTTLGSKCHFSDTLIILPIGEYSVSGCLMVPTNSKLETRERKNESYEVEWYMEKTKVIVYQVRIGMSVELDKSNSLPLLNLIWPLKKIQIRR